MYVKPKMPSEPYISTSYFFRFMFCFDKGPSPNYFEIPLKINRLKFGKNLAKI